MYRSLLSVLLLGMVPASPAAVPVPREIQRMTVAAPSVFVRPAGALSASGVLVLDALSGQEVYARDADVQRPMASITKLMTALIIAEHHQLSEVVLIPQGVDAVAGNKAYLPPGERFTVGDLLSAMLISSANDAALALAIYHSGSVQAFVEQMNRRANILGLQHTSYANPVGLDDPAQWSTPRDIAWLVQAVLRRPELVRRMGMREARIASLEGTPIALMHTHAMLRRPAVITGGKTGTTADAGECLVSLVEESGRQYIVVLLRSAHRYGDMQTILAALAPADGGLASTEQVSLRPVTLR